MRRGNPLIYSALGAAAWPWQRGRSSLSPRGGSALMNTTAENPSSQAQITAFTQGLQELGWTIGRNLRIDYRWGAADFDQLHKYGAELVALSPDVMLAAAGATVGALQRASRTVPIVFVSTIDPVGGGWVESLARPGTNATGFEFYEFSIAGKWLATMYITRKAVSAGVGPSAASAARLVIRIGGADLRTR
jgi:putative tryptophan/tyrosine transport system substrate-binding protein